MFTLFRLATGVTATTAGIGFLFNYNGSYKNKFNHYHPDFYLQKAANATRAGFYTMFTWRDEPLDSVVRARNELNMTGKISDDRMSRLHQVLKNASADQLSQESLDYLDPHAELFETPLSILAGMQHISVSPLINDLLSNLRDADKAKIIDGYCARHTGGSHTHLRVPLKEAIKHECPANMQVLIKHGADVNSQRWGLDGEDMNTPLHFLLGYFMDSKYNIQGNDAVLRDSFKNSPHAGMATILIQHGADPSKTNCVDNGYGEYKPAENLYQLYRCRFYAREQGSLDPRLKVVLNLEQAKVQAEAVESFFNEIVADNQLVAKLHVKRVGAPALRSQ